MAGRAGRQSDEMLVDLKIFKFSMDRISLGFSRRLMKVQCYYSVTNAFLG